MTPFPIGSRLNLFLLFIAIINKVLKKNNQHHYSMFYALTFNNFDILFDIYMQNMETATSFSHVLPLDISIDGKCYML